MTTTTAIGRTMTGAIGAAVMLSALAVAPDAGAQTLRCADRHVMVSALNKKYKETLQGVGLISSQRVMELYISGRGSWTVLFTHPNGKSCIGATGSNWEQMPVIDALPPAT